MESSKIDVKRKQYLDQVGNALRVIYAIIHLVPEKYREKLRETYTLLKKTTKRKFNTFVL
jgi:hypothetical protein